LPLRHLDAAQTTAQAQQLVPGPAGYRELFTDEALMLRARNCDVHQGDWAVVLPVVAAFLAAIPAAADTLSIAQAARSDPRFETASASTIAAWRWHC